MKRLRILFADDHAVVRRGLKSLVEAQPGLKVVAEAANGVEAVKKAVRLKPDVAILDINMPSMNGLEAARRIRAVLPKTEVLILTVHDSAQIVDEVLESGARGWVLKSEAEEDLVQAIHALGEHKAHFSSGVAAVIAETRRSLARGAGGREEPERLTRRERQVLRLLAHGKVNKEVAAALNISKKTAEVHRAHIMSKLKLHSIVELTRYAIRMGLAEP